MKGDTRTWSEGCWPKCQPRAVAGEQITSSVVRFRGRLARGKSIPGSEHKVGCRHCLHCTFPGSALPVVAGCTRYPGTWASPTANGSTPWAQPGSQVRIGPRPHRTSLRSLFLKEIASNYLPSLAYTIPSPWHSCMPNLQSPLLFRLFHFVDHHWRGQLETVTFFSFLPPCFHGVPESSTTALNH